MKEKIFSELAILGGKKINNREPVQWCNSLDNKEKQAVLNVLESGVLSGFQASPNEMFWGGNKVQELEPKTKKPPMFDVILLNDDFTPMDFVVYVLKEIFNHADQKANQIMLKVHNEGEASCGIFTKDVAETKSFEVNNLAKINDHPLISIVKPNYD